MKILIYTDLHYSKYSSIVRTRGKKYSSRIENCIQSVNWAENLATKEKCDSVICLGDFFDKAELTAEELTSLNEINWANLPHYYLVGNHETTRADCSFSSLHVLNGFPNSIVIDKIQELNIDNSEFNLLFLPYILEENRKPLSEILPQTTKPRIILSHNDIKNIRYGYFETTEGFEIDDIQKNCNFFVNGHIHNSGYVSKNGNNILNLGNLTGQNFSEDATLYDHYAVILDTNKIVPDEFGNLLPETLFFTNPYAYRFYKLDIKNLSELQFLKNTEIQNAVVSIRCEDKINNEVRDFIESLPNIQAHRIISYQTDHAGAQSDSSEINELRVGSIDYIKKFIDFILDTLGKDEKIQNELTNIVGG